MSENRRVVAQSGLLVRRLVELLGGATRIVLDGETLTISRSDGSRGIVVETHHVDSITIHRQVRGLGWTLAVISNDGERHRIYGLGETEAKGILAIVTRDAVLQANTVGPRLRDLYARLSPGRYLRHAESLRLHREIVEVLRECSQLVEKALSDTDFRAFAGLNRVRLGADFERARGEYNRQFIGGRLPQVRATALTHFQRSLTDEQCESVSIDEDVTLVLAGAGTGKTSIITAKVADLIVNQGVALTDILLLAFNNAAAREIQDRLPEAFTGVNVSTFHKLGLDIISDARRGKPSVSELAEDDAKRLQFFQERLDNMVSDPVLSDTLLDYITYYGRPYKSPWDFENQIEYLQYVKDVDLITLKGERVKSHEELMIANFLARHGVEYEYERDYEHITRTKERRQYKPDFYLPREQIYIEHFALDEDGRAPQDWDWHAYEDGVQWKRKAHKRHGTKLVETYSWQRKNGVLLDRLEEILRDRGVTLRPKPVEELLDELGEYAYSRLAEFAAQFLNHFKTSRLTVDELQERVQRFGDIPRAKVFLEVFQELYRHYESHLAQTEDIDFHDMINGATDVIHEGHWQPLWKYILVDEFQDISAGRLGLLKALKRDGVVFFLVGDDWQSIYRFTGSDVSLVKNCGDHLGFVEQRTIQQTFRYGEDIEKVSSWFVQKNPAQIRRTVRPFGDVQRNHGITVVWQENVPQNPLAGLMTALADIQERLGSAPAFAYTLSRYRHTLNKVRGVKQDGRIRVRHSTVHSAKGEEDEYVIVFDLIRNFRSRIGFPSGGEDEPLLELVLPTKSTDDAFDFAEERRLFYVAMTRAKYGVYLIADQEKPSPFVDELLQQFGQNDTSNGAVPRIETVTLREIGARLRKCPRCEDGRLVVRHRRSDGNPFLGCTNYGTVIRCRHTASDFMS